MCSGIVSTMKRAEQYQPVDGEGLTEHEENSLKQWYLIMAKPNQDERAEINLVRQGYEVYRPMARVPKTRRGKRVMMVESLFPRYQFIRLQRLVDNWAPIRSTYGVLTLVRFGLIPAVVPEELVKFLRENESDFEKNAISLNDFKKNDRVKIIDGPLQGCEAIFQNYDGKERAILLLKFLGRTKKVAVGSGTLIGV